ncbi:MAG: pyridoxal-phosphate dependent enzyme [Pseudomonas sp.]|uniref:pyridoxal-phosphate dependent enzyme n=1 Tax=Pseudomonas sp. TaxID=306 RepID=UPI0030F24D64
MPLHIQTPVLQSRPLSLKTGKTVWLKLDALQPVGSFKIRGIGAVCETYARAGKTRFVSSSGGNAGIAVAYAGRQLNIAVTVVVPETATAHACALIEQEGAEVIVHGASWMEANALAQSLLDEHSAFIHPFDNAEMWAGHGSLIDEVVSAGIEFDSVIVAVGGGGLLSGVIAGLQRNDLGHLPVLTVETHGADSLAQSVAAGQRIELPAITSIATSLGAKAVCENAFAVSQSHNVRCATVTDLQALNACEQFLHDHRVLVEPACGAALAALYSADPGLTADFKAPLVVVCGGATATLAQIQQWRQNLSA